MSRGVYTYTLRLKCLLYKDNLSVNFSPVTDVSLILHPRHREIKTHT